MAHFMPSDYSTPHHNQTQHGGMIHNTYVFPLLKTGEIEQCMSELGIELSKAEMMEPHRHKEKLRKVFYHLLELCCGITEKQLKEAGTKHKGGDSTTSYPELHEDMTDMVFFRELRKAMYTCGVDDFSWRDLHNPMTKRFRCQLSAFINMAKFREEQLRVYAELNEPRVQLVATLQEVEKENAVLMDQRDQVQEESAEKMMEMDKVIAECQHLEGEIARCNKLQASKREEAAALKKEVNTLKDELASATWAYQETQAEEEALRGQVVSSPDRRKNELESKKEKLEQDKEELRNMQEELQLNKKKHHNVQQAIKTIQEAVEFQQQILDEAAKYKKIAGQLDETTKEIQGTVEKTLEIENQIEEADRAYVRTSEKLAHMRKQGKMKMDAVLDRIEVAKEQLLLVEKERQEGAARIDAGEAEVRALEEQMEAEKQKTDREIEALVAEYKETEKAFLARNEKRMAVIDAALEAAS